MTTAKILTKQDILSAEDINHELVHIPEWGGSVYVRPLTGAQRDRLENEAHRRSKGKGIDIRGLKVQFVIASCVSEDGELLFNRTDLEELNAKSSKGLDAIFQVCQRLSGLSDDDVEELVGNFEAGRSGGSGSGLPAISE